MLKYYFDKETYDKYTKYFLEKFSEKGIIHKYMKNEIIKKEPGCIYIVIKGRVIQELISKNGKKITLFMLNPGTIFGEMEYFDKSEACSVSTVMFKDTVISIVPHNIIRNELKDNPELYDYLIYTMIRKYRILMLKYADDNFNDFNGKLASTLIRFAVMESGDLYNGAVINNIQNLTVFSRYLSCSRSTVSIAINKLKEEGVIKLNKNQIIIKDKEKLEGYVNYIW
ncbi:cAMP-binding domain of CRP or a regulatory subunit of cAMP-dependent protein kinases [Dethiosulfatibacter aminovorans DSM 17477]|uniref:cAMP-binding domain of CRP or a regulatory subunit of cAMP-dependent protein kinases n=1 Tax=Dethiosulfatibacter aminovorans DSM 17477 TaxID=1121476 RepID=A0A1M6N6Y0_9FIRM|nr:Crp/Fnr family transcriptional regulator [Dethiosulfatibacter aminovorans]SHJ91479.1 cAMP-binding domain of CRP or a regulatory subunit of cAMP-dependent protein kinases [Dethiosulfatibacter aminovorans DSM 17477]